MMASTSAASLVRVSTDESGATTGSMPAVFRIAVSASMFGHV
jgi:hypothetical protein